MKKILILGSTSNIGYRLRALNTEHDIYGLCRNWPLSDNKHIKEFEEINLHKIKDAIESIKPDVLINCLNMADVDKCEMENIESEFLNYELPIQLCDLCSKLDISAINFSSSLVYKGSEFPYREDSEFFPLNKYGKLKEKTDYYIRNNLKKGILLRPSSIFGKKEGFQRPNPVSFIIEKLINQEQFLLAVDISTNLLFLDDLVNIIFSIIDKDVYGEFNIGGPETINRFELGNKVQNLLPNLKGNFDRCYSDDLNIVANRPKTVILDNTKIFNEIDFCLTNTDMAIKKILHELGLR